MGHSHQPLNQPVWLLRGVQSASGMLRLSNGTISFSCDGQGQLFAFQLRKLERQLGQKGLAEHLEQDRRSQLFSLPATACGIRWPWYYFSGGFVITLDNGVKLRLSFARPNSTRGMNQNIQLSTHGAVDAMAARQVGKQWKYALQEIFRTV